MLTANTGQSEKNRTQENCLLPYHLLTVHQKKIPSDQISFAADAAEFQEGNNKYTVKTPYEDKEIQISAYTDGEPLTKANEEYASIKPGQLLWLSDSCYLRKKENGYQITDKDSKNQLLYSEKQQDGVVLSIKTKGQSFLWIKDGKSVSDEAVKQTTGKEIAVTSDGSFFIPDEGTDVMDLIANGVTDTFPISGAVDSGAAGKSGIIMEVMEDKQFRIFSVTKDMDVSSILDKNAECAVWLSDDPDAVIEGGTIESPSLCFLANTDPSE